MVEIKNNTMKHKLEELGLCVRQCDNTYVCRTAHDNLLVVAYSYDELLDENVWTFEAFNLKTVNAATTEDEILGIVKYYLKN